MIAQSVDQFQFFPDVEREILAAGKLETAGFYTEAGLRLGRAWEAAMYAAAREFNLPLTDVTIEEIDNLRRQLQDRMGKIIQEKTPNAVRGLAEISKKLSEAIAALTENAVAREGQPSESPRRTDALLREFLRIAPTSRLQRQLAREGSETAIIRKLRNRVSHAALDGGERELSKDQYTEMNEAVENFLVALTGAVLGFRADARIRGQGEAA